MTTRYCKLCGLGPREWMECEMPDCEIETQAEADARAAKAMSAGTAKTEGLGPQDASAVGEADLPKGNHHG